MRHNLVLWIIHTFTHTQTHTHTQRLYSLAVVSLYLIFADLHAEGLTEVSTQSPDAQTQRIGSPLSWPPRSNALPICTQCCRGDRLGQTVTLAWPPGSVASLPWLLGNMTTYTRPCQTRDWHVPAHLDQHSHPPWQITPKTQTDDRISAGYLLSCHLPYATHTHTHTHTLFHYKLIVSSKVSMSEAAGNKRRLLFSSDCINVVQAEPRPQEAPFK